MASLYLLEDATYFALQTSSTGYTTATQNKKSDDVDVKEILNIACE